jgi:hypothetical protein
VVSYKADRLESQIRASLDECAGSVKQTGRGRWDFALVNGKSLPVTARLSDDWLLFDAPVRDRLEGDDLWRLLRLNGTLGSLCKFVLMPDRHSVHLRADVPLARHEGDPGDFDDDLNPTGAVSLTELCSDLKAGFHSFKEEQISVPAVSQVDSAACEHLSEELRQRCADAGWPFIERSPGTLMVELNARGGFYQAIVQRRGMGAHLSVELSSFDDLSGAGRQALSTLLLSGGGQVKLASPAVDEQPDRIAVRFRVVFSALPAVGELTHALSALSIASEICGRETRAIQDDSIARHYLAISDIAAELAESRKTAISSAAD